MAEVSMWVFMLVYLGRRVGLGGSILLTTKDALRAGAYTAWGGWGPFSLPDAPKKGFNFEASVPGGGWELPRVGELGRTTAGGLWKTRGRTSQAMGLGGKRGLGEAGEGVGLDWGERGANVDLVWISDLDVG